MSMYEFIASTLPQKIVSSYRKSMTYAGIEKGQMRLLGFVFLFGLGVSFAAGIAAFSFFSFSAAMSAALFAVVFLLLEAAVYARIMLAADSRGWFVDRVLPDALQLVSMHLKSGLTIDRALLNAARREFGPLGDRILHAGKQIVAGKDVKDAFMEIPEKIKSETLEKSIILIVEGLESGGELANLLRETAEDIHAQQVIDKEIKATVMTYAIFIFFAAAIGAPLIFGISTFLVETLTAKTAEFSIPDVPEVQTGSFINPGSQIQVDPGFLKIYAVLSLMITGFFASLIMGIIRHGSQKQGIKYIPIMTALSLVIFFGTRWFVSNTFGF